jgi:hypothetical protein
MQVHMKLPMLNIVDRIIRKDIGYYSEYILHLVEMIFSLKVEKKKS